MTTVRTTTTDPADLGHLRPIRTLTIAWDLGFREQALTALAPLGPSAFAVTTFDRPEEVVRLAVEEAVDVLVLDVTCAAPVLATVLAGLATGAPRIGVVPVADAPSPDAAVPVLAKWGPAEELTAAVRAACVRDEPFVGVRRGSA